MTRPLRVLTLIDAFRMGGAETLLAPLAGAARDAGIEMEFTSLSPASMNADKTIAILTEAGVRPRSLHVRRLVDPTALPQLVREIRRSRCDIVHAHLEMAMTLAVPAARLARRPVVATFHHVHRPLQGRAAKRELLAVKAATKSDLGIFVSQASRESFADAYYPGGMPPNWAVVHNGIDVATFAPGPADPRVRAEVGGAAAADGPLVVIPAAFRDFKGIPVAVEAWAQVRSAFPEATLALVGGGELEGELRAQVADLGLGDSVRFAGVRTDMPAVYRAADVVLLPSTHGENLPTVLIEASASGRPIAASRVGGVPDIVADGETGLLFEPRDPAALAGTLKTLLGDPGLRDRLADAAVTRAHTHFSASAWVDQLRGVYATALARRK